MIFSLKHPSASGVYSVRMKKQFFLMALAASMVLPLSAETDTPLGKQMDAMNSAIKGLRKETDPAKCAALVREAQEAAAKGFSEVPELLKKMPDGAEKTKALAEYRKMMGKLYVSLCEMEIAYLDGKTEEAASIGASLKDLKKAGHDKFMEDE